MKKQISFMLDKKDYSGRDDGSGKKKDKNANDIK